MVRAVKGLTVKTHTIKSDTSVLLPLDQYGTIIVCFSGGKDSTAALLHLLELGAPRDRLELWHHAIDGAGDRFMDWPVTGAYVRAIGKALGLATRFQWKEGGFLREMLRDDQPTAPTRFELPDGTVGSVGGHGPKGTRRQFPQVSADLRQRWCSAYLKIDVARAAITNDPRFAEATILEVTGERRQESCGRARYAEVERHRSTNRRRRVDQWRAVIDWTEEQVWEIIRRWRIRPHPAYYLGWGRVSCATCIFGDRNQWASARALMPEAFARVAAFEREFGKTIHRTRSTDELADLGLSFLPDDPRLRALALSESYPDELAFVPGDQQWSLPPGAFKRAGGPS